MSNEETNSILRELDLFRKENREDHLEIKEHAKHTNGAVADLVTWKIQVRTVLWIFGMIISAVVVPVLVGLIHSYILKHF